MADKPANPTDTSAPAISGVHPNIAEPRRAPLPTFVGGSYGIGGPQPRRPRQPGDKADKPVFPSKKEPTPFRIKE